MSLFDCKQFELLHEFTAEDAEALAELLDERTVREGRAIFREGDEADGLVLIASGSVRLQSKRDVELSGFEAGSAFGGVSLLVVGKRECNAMAETECRVLTLGRTAYRRLVDDAPRTACRLTEAVVNELVGSFREGLDQIVPVLDGRR